MYFNQVVVKSKVTICLEGTKLGIFHLICIIDINLVQEIL